MHMAELPGCGMNEWAQIVAQRQAWNAAGQTPAAEKDG
jgi:hypothetical protein